MPATSTFLIGSCIGDAVIPLLIGVLMQHLGVQAFGYSMLVAVLLIWTGLGIVGWAASWGREEVKEERKEEVA